MSPLVTGSLAYDYLMRVSGKLADRLPAAADKAFTAAYIAPALSRALGGCAGNISYALHKLGASPVLLATAGSDFSPYADYLEELGISAARIKILPDFYTAQAYVVTDEGGSQLIFFHPGATGEAHRQSVRAAPAAPLAIVAPNGKEGMLQHCRELADLKTPFIFDPGQAIGLFSAAELAECLTLASYAIFNEDEFKIFEQVTGCSAEQAAASLRALVITGGENGSRAMIGDDAVSSACVHLGETQDPTGCGDAYRAGLIIALLRGWAWQTALDFASVIAAVKAAHRGGQGYELSYDAAAAHYQRIFQQPLPA